MIELKIHMMGMGIVLTFVFAATLAIIFSKHHFLLKLWGIVAMIMAALLFVQRDTYLRFLGVAALPASVIKDAFIPSNANVTANVKIDAPDGTKVIYWASQKSEDEHVYPNPWVAYDKYQNAGVAEVRSGNVVFKFFCPAKYRVPTGKILNRHVHYRICDHNGMIGRVETTFVDC